MILYKWYVFIILNEPLSVAKLFIANGSVCCNSEMHGHLVICFMYESSVAGKTYINLDPGVTAMDNARAHLRGGRVCQARPRTVWGVPVVWRHVHSWVPGRTVTGLLSCGVMFSPGVRVRRPPRRGVMSAPGFRVGPSPGYCRVASCSLPVSGSEGHRVGASCLLLGSGSDRHRVGAVWGFSVPVSGSLAVLEGFQPSRNHRVGVHSKGAEQKPSKQKKRAPTQEPAG